MTTKLSIIKYVMDLLQVQLPKEKYGKGDFENKKCTSILDNLLELDLLCGTVRPVRLLKKNQPTGKVRPVRLLEINSLQVKYDRYGS